MAAGFTKKYRPNGSKKLNFLAKTQLKNLDQTRPNSFRKPNY